MTLRTAFFAPLLLGLGLWIVEGEAQAEITEGLTAAGWKEITFDGLTPNRWSEIPGGAHVASDRSVSVIFRSLAADLAQTPILTWKWRTSAAPIPTDLTQLQDEDRAAAIYVGFPYEPKRAGFWEALGRPIVTSREGRDAPGRLLIYTWGGDQPRGTILQRRRRSDVNAIKILRTPEAPIDQWLMERVDVGADFRAAFGWEAPNPTHVGIVSDSDDTGRAVDASVIDITYVTREAGDRAASGGGGTLPEPPDAWQRTTE